MKSAKIIEPNVEAFMAFLLESNPVQHALIAGLRSQILALDPSVREDFKYGGIIFTLGKPFCGLYSYREHVSLELSEGALLVDDGKIFVGSGKHRRHIKLMCYRDISHKKVSGFLRLAFEASKNNLKNVGS